MKKANVMIYVTIEGKNFHTYAKHTCNVQICLIMKKEATHTYRFFQGFVGEEEIVFILFPSHFTGFSENTVL